MKLIVVAIKLAILAACLLYLSDGIDFRLLVESVRTYDLPSLALVFPALLVFYFMGAFRVFCLAPRRISFAVAFKSYIVGAGLNNVLPAKLGELAKMQFLVKHGKLNYARALSTIFWERFFDVNALFVFMVILFFYIGSDVSLSMFVTLLLLVWGTVFILHFSPSFQNHVMRIVPSRFKEKVLSLLHATLDNFSARKMTFGVVTTLGVWLSVIVFAYCFLLNVARLDLTFGQVTLVIAVLSAGVAIPAVPGALGLYEASIVFALSQFGIHKEVALPVAIGMHVVEIIPSTLASICLVIMEKAQKDSPEQGEAV